MTAPVLKAAVLAVFAAMTVLLIRRGSPELSAALAIAVCCAILTAALSLGEPILQLVERARELTGLSSAVLSPVLKCVGIAILTSQAAGICRDGGQGALASAVELVGAVGSVYAALPLLSSFLDMLEELLR